jgi:PAS domain S-box-containing protein
MNVDIKRSFPRLKNIAAFILENHAEEFTRDYLDRLKAENLPLLTSDILKNMTEEEMFATILKSNIDTFLKPVSEDKGLEEVVRSTERWRTYVKTDSNPADISISDLIIAYEARKLSLFKFLPLYEPISFELIKEIEDFFKDCAEITFQTFVELFQQRLTDNELFIRKIADASPSILFLFDLKKMKRLYMSQKIKDYLGYTFEELETSVDPQTGSLIYPEDREKMLHRYEDYKKGLIDHGIFEYRTRHANGEWRWMRSYENVYKRDDNGLPVQIVGSIIDVTDRKNIESELKELNEDLEAKVKEQTSELQKSYDQLRLILDSFPQMAWTAEPNGKIDFFSNSWINYIGDSLFSMDPTTWKDFIHPDDFDKTVKTWKEALEKGKEFEYENRIKRASDNTYRWSHTKALPLKDSNGNVFKWVGTTTDIHEQKTVTEELEKKVSERTSELMLSNVELTRINNDLEQFAYVASHDLKEPLRMVGSYLQLLKKSLVGKLDAEQEEFITYISSGADRMNALINDLLNYSRIIKDPAALQKVDCNTILEIVKQNLTAVIEDTNTVIKSSKLPTITGIESQIIQLFQNLIANAIKFRRKDTTPVIEIKSMPDTHEWLFSITDNGLGIAPQFRDKIFVIFQRLHNRSEYPGTGIGLAVCKKIVELYGGKIWFDSTPGVGTTFYFTIPKVIKLTESLF